MIDDAEHDKQRILQLTMDLQDANAKLVLANQRADTAEGALSQTRSELLHQPASEFAGL